MLDSSACWHRSGHRNGEADACIEARPQLFEYATNNFRVAGTCTKVSRSSSIVVKRSTHPTVEFLRGLLFVSFEFEESLYFQRLLRAYVFARAV